MSIEKNQNRFPCLHSAQQKTWVVVVQPHQSRETTHLNCHRDALWAFPASQSITATNNKPLAWLGNQQHEPMTWRHLYLGAPPSLDKRICWQASLTINPTKKCNESKQNKAGKHWKNTRTPIEDSSQLLPWWWANFPTSQPVLEQEQNGLRNHMNTETGWFSRLNRTAHVENKKFQ